MNREETLKQIEEIQSRVRQLRRATEIPTIERTMQLLDMYCHMARWELGDVHAMTPETEAS